MSLSSTHWVFANVNEDITDAVRTEIDQVIDVTILIILFPFQVCVFLSIIHTGSISVPFCCLAQSQF